MQDNEEIQTGRDSQLDSVVDDISRSDGDELIEHEDETKGQSSDGSKNPVEKLKNIFKAWWQNRKLRYISLGVAFMLIVLTFVIPISRYFVINLVGVRTTASVTIVDKSTQLPLKNVEVSIQNKKALTNKNGEVKLEHLKLGRTKISFNKKAFAEGNQSVTLGWRNNKLGSYTLQPVGTQFSFLLKDWLSGEPIKQAEATIGSASALSDDKGKILLTLDNTDIKDKMEVKIAAEEYRTETVTIDNDTSLLRSVNMVIKQKHIFVSKQTGKYNVYSIDADGKNEQKVLDGTGYERDDIVLVSNAEKGLAALVSTRVNARNSEGFLLDTLSLIDVNDNSTISVAQSEDVQIVGWSGNKLLYIEIAAGASASNPERYQLKSYDAKTQDKKTIAKANSFNDVVFAGGNIYFAPDSAYAKGKNIGLIKASPDGNTNEQVFAKEVSNIIRVSYEKLDLAIGGGWYEYDITTAKTTKMKGPPSSQLSRVYIDSPDGKNSVWVDAQGDKTAIINHDSKSGAEKSVKLGSGFSNPLGWLNNNTIVYRSNTNKENADYSMSIATSRISRIADVADSKGIDRWYYYQ